jgi:predicted nucleotidyltransferase
LSIEKSPFEQTLLALLNHEVDFVVIGGLAMMLIGSDVLTQDADFAISLRRANAKAVAVALSPYDPKPVDWPAGLPFIWDDQTVFSSSTLTLTTELGRIDLLAEPAGAPPYPLLKERAVTFEMAGKTVYVACIEDLIAMKQAAGRPKDLAHIAELENIQRILADEG